MYLGLTVFSRFHYIQLSLQYLRLEVQIAVQKFKSYKSSCTDQILAELIKQGMKLLFTIRVMKLTAVVLSDLYRILSNINFSRLTSYVDEITGNHQCLFRHTSNGSITVMIFCMHQTPEVKMGVQWDSTSATYNIN
jgi:hypothetical protein